MSFYQHHELATEDLPKARSATKDGPLRPSYRQEADQRKRTSPTLHFISLCEKGHWKQSEEKEMGQRPFKLFTHSED